MSLSRVSPLRSRILAAWKFSSQSRSASSTPASASRPPNPHANFYRTHGRALFKSLTMAFLSYQIFYWAWITLEADMSKDEKNRTLKGLEEEVKLLGSGVGSHRLLEERSGEEREEVK